MKKAAQLLLSSLFWFIVYSMFGSFGDVAISLIETYKHVTPSASFSMEGRTSEKNYAIAKWVARSTAFHPS